MKKLLKFIFIFILLLISIIAIIAAIAFVKHKDIEEHIDISYGEHERNKMDVYLPNDSGKGSYGAIIFIHGGSWTGGDKSSELYLCKEYVTKGYVTATINYRYIGRETSLWDNMDDISSAIETLKNYCNEKGYNVTSLALHGYSSGAHLATTFAYAMPERSAIPLSFVVNKAGCADFHSDTWNEWSYDEDTGPRLAYMLYGYENLGDYITNGEIDSSLIPDELTEKIINSVSPISYITSDSLPTVCAFATVDGVVPTKNKTLTHAYLTENGVKHDFFEFENSNHALIGDPLTLLGFYKKMSEYCGIYFGY